MNNLKIKIPNKLIKIKSIFKIIINRNILYIPNFNIIDAKVIDQRLVYVV